MSYVFDANTDPNERTRRRKLAEALMLKATDAGPIASPWQGAAKMAQALMGGIELGRYDKQDREDRAYGQQGLADLDRMSGTGAQTQGTSPVAAALASPPSFTQTGGKMAQAPSDLAPYFDEASKMTGIPAPVLMAKVQQESRFNPNAVGKAGEVGLAQIMPSTARDPGFGMQGVDPQSLRDPRTNILFGAQYLAARGKAAGVTDWNDRNQVAKALTAYNGGGDPNYAQHVMRFLPQGPLSPVAAAIQGGGGQPAMAGGDTLQTPPQATGGQPAGLMAAGQPAAASPNLQRLMAIAFDPRAPKNVQDRAKMMIQMAQKDDSVTHVDLGTSVGIMDKRGNIVRQIPKGKDPNYSIQVAPDGTALRVNNLDGSATPVGNYAKPENPDDLRKKRADADMAERNLGKPLVEPSVAEKDYAKDMADRKARGMPDVPYGEWLTNYKKSGAQTVTVDQRAENEEAKQRSQGLGKRLNDIADEGGKAQDDEIVYQRFGQLLNDVQTGRKTQVLETIRQLTGVALDPNTDNVQALNAAIQYLAPRLRVPGSGAQSDRELGNFMASIPSLAGTPGGNQKIMDTLAGMAQYRRERSRIAQAWQSGEISGKEASKQIDDLQSPFSPPVKIPASMAPDEVAKKYRSGTRIILPDGTPGVVP